MAYLGTYASDLVIPRAKIGACQAALRRVFKDGPASLEKALMHHLLGDPCQAGLNQRGDLEIRGLVVRACRGDDELVHTIAPFVARGGTIMAEGEEGDHWRWDFDGRAARHRTGRLVWNQPA